MKYSYVGVGIVVIVISSIAIIEIIRSGTDEGAKLDATETSQSQFVSQSNSNPEQSGFPSRQSFATKWQDAFQDLTKGRGAQVSFSNKFFDVDSIDAPELGVRRFMTSGEDIATTQSGWASMEYTTLIDAENHQASFISLIWIAERALDEASLATFSVFWISTIASLADLTGEPAFDPSGDERYSNSLMANTQYGSELAYWCQAFQIGFRCTATEKEDTNWVKGFIDNRNDEIKINEQ